MCVCVCVCVCVFVEAFEEVAVGFTAVEAALDELQELCVRACVRVFVCYVCV